MKPLRTTVIFQFSVHFDCLSTDYFIIPFQFYLKSKENYRTTL
jgi:hypothetical protein